VACREGTMSHSSVEEWSPLSSETGSRNTCPVLIIIPSLFVWAIVMLPWGCVPVAEPTGLAADQSVPQENEPRETVTCPFSTFLISGECMPCPHQAHCCDQGFWFSIDDELCHGIPDACEAFAQSQPRLSCQGISSDPGTPAGNDERPSGESTDVLLRVNVVGPGVVSVSPIGIPDGTGFRYAIDTVVTLSANPYSGFVFEGWTGSRSSLQSVIMVTLLEDTQLTATFDEPPFVAGNVFSFLSVPETTLFRAMVAIAVDDAVRWHQNELQRIRIEYPGNSRDSILIQLACDTDIEATRMKRDGTWRNLDEELGFTRLSLHLVGAIDEVEQWNCQQYPDPQCVAIRLCR